MFVPETEYLSEKEKQEVIDMYTESRDNFQARLEQGTSDDELVRKAIAILDKHINYYKTTPLIPKEHSETLHSLDDKL